MLFVTTEAMKVAKLRGRLTEAQSAVLLAEERLRVVGIDVALSDDPVGATASERSALRDAKDRVALLEQAVDAADEAEAARVARAKANLKQSQVRALRQHVSQVVAASADAEAAIEAYIVAYRKMVSAGESCRKLIPASHFFGDAFASGTLGAACINELRRYCPDPGARGAPLGPPGMKRPEIGQIDSEKPLSQRMRTELLAGFAAYTGTKPATEGDADAA